MLPPRPNELIVFEKPPRFTACQAGVVYRVTKPEEGGYRFVLAESIGGYERGVTVDYRTAKTAIWRPARADERESAIK